MAVTDHKTVTDQHCEHTFNCSMSLLYLLSSPVSDIHC